MALLTCFRRTPHMRKLSAENNVLVQPQGARSSSPTLPPHRPAHLRMSRPGNLLQLLPVQEAGDSPHDKPPALTEPKGGCELKKRGMHPDWQDLSSALLATPTRRTGILQYPCRPGSVIENKQGRLRSDMTASCLTSTVMVNPPRNEPDQPTAHGCPITIDP